MKRFDNKNFRISSVEIIDVIVFFCLLMCSAFFFNSFNKTKSLYNISKTKVDYIIQAPSAEQITEISQLEHIDKVTPYFYRTVDVPVGSKNISANLFIVESISDRDYTSFSDSLAQKVGTAGKDGIYVTEDLANNAGISVGDNLDLTLDGNLISFIVNGIYESDHRMVGGSLLTVLTDDVKNAMKSLKYSGAYISSNNLQASDNYFENEYIPMGNLRSRDEFETDEAYQRYIATQGQEDASMATFFTSDYVSEISRRNDARLTRNMIVAIISLAAAYIIMMVIVSVRASEYTKHNVLRDVRDNFTIEQESGMYSRYFTSVSIIMLAANLGTALIGLVTGWVKIVSPLNIICLTASIVLMILCGNVQKTKLKNRFLVEQKKYEEEKRKEKETKIETAKQAENNE